MCLHVDVHVFYTNDSLSRNHQSVNSGSGNDDRVIYFVLWVECMNLIKYIKLIDAMCEFMIKWQPDAKEIHWWKIEANPIRQRLAKKNTSIK